MYDLTLFVVDLYNVLISWYSISGFHTGGGGFIPLMIFARGDIPPIKLQNSVFCNGHFSEVLQESVQKTNPLFFSKFVFSNCPPHKFFSGGNPVYDCCYHRCSTI